MSDRKNNLKSCAAIILAAGNSSRMKSPKFALAYDINTTFLEKIIQEYSDFGCEEIIVVLSEENEIIAHKLHLKLDKATLVINHHPEWERFYSIKVGLLGLTRQYPVFIHNVDNPFVNLAILEGLWRQKPVTDYIIPTYEDHGGHPILVSNEISQAIITEKNHELILSDFLKRYAKKRIAVDDARILENINTKEIYHKLFK